MSKEYIYLAAGAVFGLFAIYHQHIEYSYLCALSLLLADVAEIRRIIIEKGEK